MRDGHVTGHGALTAHAAGGPGSGVDRGVVPTEVPWANRTGTICQKPQVPTRENTRSEARRQGQHRKQPLPSTDRLGGGGSQGGSECGVQPRATCRLCSGSQRATDGKQQQKEETHPGQLSVPRGSCCCFQRHDVVTAKGLQKALTFSRGTWEHPPVRGQTSRRPPNHLRGEREDDTRIGRPRKQEAGPGSPPPLRPPPCREAETPCHGA